MARGISSWRPTETEIPTGHLSANIRCRLILGTFLGRGGNADSIFRPWNLHGMPKKYGRDCQGGEVDFQLASNWNGNLNPPLEGKRTYRWILGTLLRFRNIQDFHGTCMESQKTIAEIAKVARGISSWRPTETEIATRHLRETYIFVGF